MDGREEWVRKVEEEEEEALEVGQEEARIGRGVRTRRRSRGEGRRWRRSERMRRGNRRKWWGQRRMERRRWR